MWPELNPSAQEPVPAHFSFSGATDEEPASQRNRNANHEPKALLQRLHEGDCELFYELTKAFLPNVYAFIRSMVDDASTADDICQQTFLTALQKVHQLKNLRCLRPWIMQIAVNQVRMVWRSTRRHPKVSIDVFAGPEIQAQMPAALIDARETPLETLARKELSRILELALRQLSPRYRSVFWLRDVEQFSGAEAAAMLGISINCVKARLLRARLKLRDHLAPIFGMEATPQSCPGKRLEQTAALREAAGGSYWIISARAGQMRPRCYFAATELRRVRRHRSAVTSKIIPTFARPTLIPLSIADDGAAPSSK